MELFPRLDKLKMDLETKNKRTDGVHPQIADDVGKVMSQDSSLADEEKHHEEQQQQQHVFPPPPSVHESIPTQPVSPSTTQDASTITKEGIYVCHLCNFSAFVVSGTRKDVFDAHMTTHFNHGCPYCDYTSRTEGRLKRHIKDFHSQDSLEAIEARKSRMMPGRPKVYRCKQCDFVATTKHTSQTNTDSQSHTQMRDEGRIEFWNHAKSHIKAEKLLQCPNCPFVTEYKHHLEYHLRNHYGSKPFKCNKCNYSCVNKSMLNSHMKSHTNVYQYRCADCTYATKYCHSLKLHLRKYNHKPATVLNMDGSLPQGFDTEAAGFTLLSKRSPARGPRGPRKDKVDPYIGHMFSLPPTSLPGIGQVMNGSMLPPYWPLMNQLPNGLQPPPLIPVSGVVTGSPQPQPPVPPPPPPQASPQDHMVPSANLFKCNLCSMSAESNEALSMHLLKVHGAENQDLFNMFGISSDSFLEEQSLRNAGHGVHAMVPSAPPHSVCQPECIDSKPINSSSSLFVPNEAPAQPTGSPSHSWPIDMQTDTKPDLSADGKTAVEISVIGSNGTSSPQSGSKNTTDIIKQMTLRFGAGPGNSDSIGMVDCPLDLTKPKSPTIYSFSNSREQMDQKLDSSEVSSSIENSLDTCSATPPKKRSRKGRAFKLDALTHKLREQQLSVSAEPPAQTDTRDEIGRNNSRSVEPLPEGADSQSDSNQGSDPVSFQIPPAERRSPIDEYQGGSFSSSAGTPNNEKPQLCNEDGSQISSAEYEQIHNNLQILNEEIQKEGLNDIPKPPPSLSHIGEGRNLPATSAAESIPGEMANDSVHQSLFNSYYSRRKSMPTPLRRGTELAWKILNDSCPPVMVPYQNGAVPCNGRRWSTNTTENVAANPSKLKLNLFSDGESYECSYCEIAFRNCAMYTMHMGYHGYQDPYKCNMCGHQSKDKIDFFLHIARAPHA